MVDGGVPCHLHAGEPGSHPILALNVHRSRDHKLSLTITRYLSCLTLQKHPIATCGLV